MTALTLAAYALIAVSYFVLTFICVVEGTIAHAICAVIVAMAYLVMLLAH